MNRKFTTRDRTEKQKLVDIMFSVAMVLHEAWSSGKEAPDREEVAAWVAQQLRGCGFPTEPVGMSWGVLLDKPEDSP